MTGDTRREKRVGLRLSLDVSGQDAGGADFAHSAHTINISGGGVCFETPRHLLVGTHLLLNIQIPAPLRGHFGGQPVYRARAVVCRVERFEGQPSSRIGARFLGDEDGDPPGSRER
jgi:PilZ domain